MQWFHLSIKGAGRFLRIIWNSKQNKVVPFVLLKVKYLLADFVDLVYQVPRVMLEHVHSLVLTAATVFHILEYPDGRHYYINGENILLKYIAAHASHESFLPVLSGYQLIDLVVNFLDQSLLQPLNGIV